MPSVDTLFERIASVAQSRVKMSFTKESLLVTKKDFQKFAEYFIPSSHFFRGRGLRTHQRIRHLHAVLYKDYIEVHIDNGNVLRNALFIPIHFLFDVLPYHVFCILRHGRWRHSFKELHAPRI